MRDFVDGLSSHSQKIECFRQMSKAKKESNLQCESVDAGTVREKNTAVDTF